MSVLDAGCSQSSDATCPRTENLATLNLAVQYRMDSDTMAIVRVK